MTCEWCRGNEATTHFFKQFTKHVKRLAVCQPCRRRLERLEGEARREAEQARLRKAQAK